MIETIGQRLLNESNLNYDDRAHYFPNLLQNPSDYLTWDDVEQCVNNPALYEFEVIDHSNVKVNIDRHVRAWVPNKTVQDSCQIVNHINHGHSIIIMNYGFYSRNTQNLLNVFERLFDVDCAIHVYGGLSGSKSFKIHDDYPCNFIIQTEGETRWKVFKNRVSQLYKIGYDQYDIKEDRLEVELDIILKPGDALYIPSRAFHCAYPDGKRLSMSIPCWPRWAAPNQTSDRNFYILND